VLVWVAEWAAWAAWAVWICNAAGLQVRKTAGRQKRETARFGGPFPFARAYPSQVAANDSSTTGTEAAGWPLLIGLGIAQIISWGTVYYSFALLMQPLQRELGARQSVIVGAYSLALLVSGLVAPWIGRTIDRRGGRVVMTAGSLAAAVLFALLARVESLVALYLIWIGLGVVMAATLYEPAFAVLTQTYGVRYRRAITVLTLFGGFASTVFWPVTAALIEQFGWREALLWLALVNLLVNVPVHGWLLPNSSVPRDTGVVAGGKATSVPFSDRAFIALALALLGQAIVMSALAVHLLALLETRGMTPVAAAAIGALVGPMQVLGRVIEFAISGRASAVGVGRVVVILLPLAVLTLYGAGTESLLLVLFALLYGTGNGAMTIVRGAVPVELWGRAQYGAIMGWLATPSMLARASGPIVASLLWVSVGGYDAVLLVLVAIAVLAAIAFHIAARGARA
jgi:MFS family permease